MLLAFLGDVHGDFAAVERAMGLEPAVSWWFSVGDVADVFGAYPSPPRPFCFIKGNNEDFDVLARLAAGERLAEHLHFLPNGVAKELREGAALVRLAGLGGTFAPTWYDRSVADLSGARRRHFVRSEVETCAGLADVDVFLSHEAAKPYWAGEGRRRNDAGKAAINEVLAAIKPRLHLFGHHHRHSEAEREGVPSIGLPLASAGWLVLDTDAWSWTMRAG